MWLYGLKKVSVRCCLLWICELLKKYGNSKLLLVMSPAVLKSYCIPWLAIMCVDRQQTENQHHEHRYAISFIDCVCFYIWNLASTMPGHEKKKKNQGDDPDPSEYLIVSMDMKREDLAKVYDSKKSFWVPDGQGGFMESVLESNDGKVAKVIVKGYEVCIIYLCTAYIT